MPNVVEDNVASRGGPLFASPADGPRRIRVGGRFRSHNARLLVM